MAEIKVVRFDEKFARRVTLGDMTFYSWGDGRVFLSLDNNNGEITGREVKNSDIADQIRTMAQAPRSTYDLTNSSYLRRRVGANYND